MNKDDTQVPSGPRPVEAPAVIFERVLGMLKYFEEAASKGALVRAEEIQDIVSDINLLQQQYTYLEVAFQQVASSGRHVCDYCGKARQWCQSLGCTQAWIKAARERAQEVLTTVEEAHARAGSSTLHFGPVSTGSGASQKPLDLTGIVEAYLESIGAGGLESKNCICTVGDDLLHCEGQNCAGCKPTWYRNGIWSTTPPEGT